MNCRRGSTTSPIRIVNILSASTALFVVQIDLQKFAFFRIHRRAEELFRVHLTETFEALDLHATPPISSIFCKISGLRKADAKRAVAFNPRLIRRLDDHLRRSDPLSNPSGPAPPSVSDGDRLVQLDELAAAACAVVTHRRSGQRQQLLPISISNKLRSRFFFVKLRTRVRRGITDGFVVAIVNFHEIGR